MHIKLMTLALFLLFSISYSQAGHWDKIKLFLDEVIYTSTGRTAKECFRPFKPNLKKAYFFMEDSIHTIRNSSLFHIRTTPINISPLEALERNSFQHSIYQEVQEYKGDLKEILSSFHKHAQSLLPHLKKVFTMEELDFITSVFYRHTIANNICYMNIVQNRMLEESTIPEVNQQNLYTVRQYLQHLKENPAFALINYPQQLALEKAPLIWHNSKRILEHKRDIYTLFTNICRITSGQKSNLDIEEYMEDNWYNLDPTRNRSSSGIFFEIEKDNEGEHVTKIITPLGEMKLSRWTQSTLENSQKTAALIKFLKKKWGIIDITEKIEKFFYYNEKQKLLFHPTLYGPSEDIEKRKSLVALDSKVLLLPNDPLIYYENISS